MLDAPAITLLWLVLSAEGPDCRDPRYRFLAMAVSRSILRCVHRRRSGPVVVSRSVMLEFVHGTPTEIMFVASTTSNAPVLMERLTPGTCGSPKRSRIFGI